MSAESASKALQRMYRAAGRPLGAMIEIADRCNESCVHCYQVQGLKGEMSTADVFRVVDDLADAGVLFLRISGGEPTLRHDFLDIVGHARDLGMAVTVFTNGLRIDGAMARALAARRVFSVEISLYSHRPEPHDRVTRVPGSWERTVAAVRHLRAEGVHVVVKAPLMRENEAEVAARQAFFRSLGCDVSYGPEPLHLREDGAEAPAPHGASAEGRRALMARFESSDARPSAEEKLAYSPCGACRNLHVEPHGEVRPCSQLGVPLGDATAPGGVRRAYQSDTARFLRGLRWRDLHGCRDCDLRPWCERCYADALAKGGDALGPYADACENARLRYEVAEGAAPEVVDAAPGRDPAVGPYRSVGGHRFRATPDERTAEDEARARAQPWVRAPSAPVVPVERLTHRRGGPLAAESSSEVWYHDEGSR